MIDFIFQVDLSTIYIILRRDFASATDRTGTLTSPVGSGFYYTAASANEAARQHCQQEAAKGLGLPGGEGAAGAVHGERDGLYRGGCVTREPGRERFEVRVRRLRAKETTGHGDRTVGVGGSRAAGGQRLGVVREESGERTEGVEGEGGSRRQSVAMSRSSSLKDKEKRGSRIGRIWETVRRK